MSDDRPKNAPDDHGFISQSTLQGGDGSGQRLVALWEGGSASAPIVGDRPLVIGRSRDCDLIIHHPSVSRHHARFRVNPGPHIEDLGSANGTRIRDTRLAPFVQAAFRAGEVVEVGAAFVVLHSGAASLPEVPTLPVGAAAAHGLPPVVIEDPKMQALDRLVHLVAQSDISVLLLGETGVGKEVFAERIHRLSHRSTGPFIRINCAALTESLLESELFGHARGAFTGASAAKKGILEAADGGTLLLDEVGELPWLTQAKLLRVLESGELLRVGESSPRMIDVRFLGATNRDLWELVHAGRFRSDLYFRLNGISLTIPSLRERRGEVLPLAAVFLESACRRARQPVPVLAAEARARLQEHSWPGNVRELRNVIERAMLLARHRTIGAEHIVLEQAPSGSRAHPGAVQRAEGPVSEGLGARPRVGAGLPTAAGLGPESSPGTEVAQASDGPETQRSGTLRGDIQELERRRIEAALEQANGNQSRAAELLGISRRTLTNRLNAFNFPRPRKGREPSVRPEPAARPAEQASSSHMATGAVAPSAGGAHQERIHTDHPADLQFNPESTDPGLPRK